MKRPIRKLTPLEEKEIRRQHFAQKRPVSQILDEWNISVARLRRIVGGPLSPRYQSFAIEAIQKP